MAGPASQPAVTKHDALAVIEKLKSGKSSVMLEAIRLGCYHATLRKALRAAVGSEQFERLMRAKTGKRKPRPYPATSKGPKHVSQPKQQLPVVKDPTRCGRCGGKLILGTNGHGFGLLSCVCGWGVLVIPRRPTAGEREQ